MVGKYTEETVKHISHEELVKANGQAHTDSIAATSPDLAITTNELMRRLSSVPDPSK